MTDPEPMPEPDPIAQPPEEPATPPAQTAPSRAPRRSVMPVIYAACVAVLVLAGVWIWQNPDFRPGAPATDPRPVAGSGPDEVAALQQQVQDLAARVSRIEAAPRTAPAAPAPAPAPAVDLRPLQARLDALEHRPEPAAAAPAANPQEIAALAAQVAAEDQRLGALGQSLASLSDRVQGTDGQLAAQLQALQGRVDATDKLAAQVSALATRAGRLTQMQAAAAALDAGRPLGTITDAPPALARFAETPPPTEAGLRLSFPEAAQQALAAAQPATGEGRFLDRVWGRMQQAVTVRAGDRVIVGNPAAGLLARAQDALDAGDLAGTVAALQALPPEAAPPMANWLGQAQSLLAARAALADLAAHA